jgi:hypothetical protein
MNLKLLLILVVDAAIFEALCKKKSDVRYIGGGNDLSIYDKYSCLIRTTITKFFLSLSNWARLDIKLI